MKGYSNAKFKGFPSQHEANLFLQQHKSNKQEIINKETKESGSSGGDGDDAVVITAPIRTTSSIPNRRNRTVAKLDEDDKHNNQQPRQPQAQPVSTKRRKLDTRSTISVTDSSIKCTHNTTDSTISRNKTNNDDSNNDNNKNYNYNNNKILQRKISIQINFDGGSRGNPGIAGAGAEIIIKYIKVVETAVVAVPRKQNNRVTTSKGTTTRTKPIRMTTRKEIIERRKKIHYRYYLGNHQKFTNNQAEYQGVICGIRQVLQELGRYQTDQQQQLDYNDELSFSSCSSHNNDDYIIPVDIVIQGDSKLIIQQLKGDYQCKSQNIIPYYNEYQDCMKELLLLMEKNTNKNTPKKKKKEDKMEVGDTNEDITNNAILMKINSITYEHVYRHDNKIADGKFHGRKETTRNIPIMLFINVVAVVVYCLDHSTVIVMVLVLNCLRCCCPHSISTFYSTFGANFLFLHFKQTNERAHTRIYDSGLANEAMDAQRSWCTVIDDNADEK